jgi:hypothetical protein
MKTDNTIRIDSYFSGLLSTEEERLFENELKTSPHLRRELELQATVMEAANRASIRKDVKSAAQHYFYTKLLKWSLGGFSVVAIIVTGLILSQVDIPAEIQEGEQVEMVSNSSLKSTKIFANHETEALYHAFVQSKSASADQEIKETDLIPELKTEIFAWKGKDSVYLSRTGVLVSIPKGAFLKNGSSYTGSAIIEWQEAIDGATIMLAGLSTMAHSNLLETQGMFSFRATDKAGNLLDVNPEIGVYVQVPVDEIKAGMQLYDGEFDNDGIINWVNPIPLEKIPVPVPMSELDFYPKGYEDTLNKLRLNPSKKYRDSLYLACEPKEIGFVSNSGYIVDEAELIHNPKRERKKVGLGSLQGSVVDELNKPISNAIITFSQRDASILKVNSNSLGRFYVDAIESGNYSVEIRHENCISPYRQDIEINAEKITFMNDIVLRKCSFNEEMYKFIPPSKVLSFWKSEFDNTLLATREFERRMQVLHSLCREDLLDLYLQNLNKPMYYIDSLVARKGVKQFEAFAAERVGAVRIDDAHLAGLQKFYNDRVTQLKENVRKIQEKERQEERDWDAKVSQQRILESIRSNQRNAQLFSEEYAFNHQQTRRQLGLSIGFSIRRNSAIKNIDRLVYEATKNRQTTTIQFNGKEAVIQYNDFSFEVNNTNQFNQIFAYLLPDKFNSYHRLAVKNGKVEYPLNDKVTYDLVILGMNEKGFHYYELRNINGGKLGQIGLNPISENQFQEKIKSINKQRLDDPLPVENEFLWLKFEQENYAVQRLRQEKRVFMRRMRSVVFPCYVETNVSVEAPSPPDIGF